MYIMQYNSLNSCNLDDIFINFVLYVVSSASIFKILFQINEI